MGLVTVTVMYTVDATLVEVEAVIPPQEQAEEYLEKRPSQEASVAIAVAQAVRAHGICSTVPFT